MSEVVAAYYASLLRHGATACSDAVDCLDRLRGTYRLGIITNGHPAVQQAKLARAGLAPYFQAATTPQVGASKPDRRIVAAGAAALGVRLEAAVYVGDMLEWDVGGANAAGMVSVWLNRSHLHRSPGDPLPSATIASLAELPAPIAGMDARR